MFFYVDIDIFVADIDVCVADIDVCVVDIDVCVADIDACAADTGYHNVPGLVRDGCHCRFRQIGKPVTRICCSRAPECGAGDRDKGGQNPFRQEKSLLQACWSIWRLRPRGVSSGSTDRQFDSMPQSPQPSQTSGLITTNASGVASSPFLRRRRLL